MTNKEWFEYNLVVGTFENMWNFGDTRDTRILHMYYQEYSNFLNKIESIASSTIVSVEKLSNFLLECGFDTVNWLMFMDGAEGKGATSDPVDPIITFVSRYRDQNGWTPVLLLAESKWKIEYRKFICKSFGSLENVFRVMDSGRVLKNMVHDEAKGWGIKSALWGSTGVGNIAHFNLRIEPDARRLESIANTIKYRRNEMLMQKRESLIKEFDNISNELNAAMPIIHNITEIPVLPMQVWSKAGLGENFNKMFSPEVALSYEKDKANDPLLVYDDYAISEYYGQYEPHSFKKPDDIEYCVAEVNELLEKLPNHMIYVSPSYYNNAKFWGSSEEYMREVVKAYRGSDTLNTRVQR